MSAKTPEDHSAAKQPLPPSEEAAAKRRREGEEEITKTDNEAGPASAEMDGTTSSSQTTQSLPASEKPSLKKPTKATIGIVGLNPREVAELNIKIVEYGNSIGLGNDQEHPNLIAVGVDADNIHDLKSCADICYDYGADIIAVVGKRASMNADAIRTHFEHYDQNDIEIFSHDRMEDLAKMVVDRALRFVDDKEEPIKTKIPDLVYKSQKKDPEEEAEMDSKRSRVIVARSKRISARKTNHGPYPILNEGHRNNHKKLSFILGGAGPRASATFAKMLADSAVSFVHCSMNSAPGKHAAETLEGPRYEPHYHMELEYAKEINLLHENTLCAIAMPCNTAHLRLKEIFAGFKDDLRPKLIDIRRTTIQSTINNEQLILLGTAATTGALTGRPGGYEQLRQKEFKANTQPFIIPTPEQQEKITRAIFDIKNGDLENAKSLILEVIGELRKPGEKNPAVILGCTELALVFEENELIGHNLIDPAKTMKAAARLKTNEVRTSKTSSRSPSPPDKTALMRNEGDRYEDDIQLRPKVKKPLIGAASNADEQTPPGENSSSSTNGNSPPGIKAVLKNFDVKIFTKTEVDASITYRVEIKLKPNAILEHKKTRYYTAIFNALNATSMRQTQEPEARAIITLHPPSDGAIALLDKWHNKYSIPTEEGAPTRISKKSTESSGSSPAQSPRAAEVSSQEEVIKPSTSVSADATESKQLDSASNSMEMGGDE